MLDVLPGQFAFECNIALCLIILYLILSGTVFASACSCGKIEIHFEENIMLDFVCSFFMLIFVFLFFNFDLLCYRKHTGCRNLFCVKHRHCPYYGSRK